MEKVKVNLGKINFGMAGRMKFSVAKAVLDKDGKQVYDDKGVPMCHEGTHRLVADWMPNQILDNGRNIMSTSSGWNLKAQVGTDSTVPNAAQTSMIAYVDGTDAIVAGSDQFAAESSSPYYAWRRMTYRFPVGDIGGQNLQEAGVGWDTIAGPYLISRALIVNSGGSPTPITPAADEILDMTYELRYYPPETPVTVTNAVTLNGIDYDVEHNSIAVTAAVAEQIGNAIGQFSQSSSDWSVYDGVSTDVADAQPAGNTAACDNADQFNLPYVAAYQQDMQCDCGINGWNLGVGATDGIRTLRWKTTVHDYRTEFSESADQTNPGNTIPKDTNFTMQFVFRIGWTTEGFNASWSRIADNDSIAPSVAEWNMNVANTLLRINWQSGTPNADQRNKLRVPQDSVFTIAQGTDPTKSIEFTMTPATDFAEQTDYTEYTGSITATGGGGQPDVGAPCDIVQSKI